MFMSSPHEMNRTRRELTLDEVRYFAPSVFAEDQHESRSDRYSYISTAAVLTKLIDEGFYPVFAQQQRVRDVTRRDYTRHVLRLRHHSDQYTTVPSVGETYPEVVLLNSHDGSSSFKLMLGLFRLVCSNGLMVGNSFAGISVRHKGNIADEVIEGSYDVINAAPQISHIADTWGRIQLNDATAQEFGSGALKVIYGERTPNITPAQIIEARRFEDHTKTDLWSMFNRVQENATKGGITYRRTDGRRRNGTTRAVRGLTRDIDLNRKLWDYTVEFAEKVAA